jgi:4-amino-4-deoxy-L-arabinose transferase-like glycosyltransferase
MRDGLGACALALTLRLSLVFWAAGRVPPAEDGVYYHALAVRIAEGLGYTWLWPDGTVTHAAHYPIGYPAILGAIYAVFGASATVAMALSALLGALGVLAVHRVAARTLGRRGAAGAAVIVAMHPALVAYVPALMTEGIVASSLAVLAWGTVRTRETLGLGVGVLAIGVALGCVALIRPQVLAIGPIVGVILASGQDIRRRASSAVLVSAMAVATCLPWTVRNCSRMSRCSFVSANVGWNLLIGTAVDGRGAWVPLVAAGVPDACRDVHSEAEKDKCFRRAALQRIIDRPGQWLALVPSKLARTFDYGGAPGWYLHAAAPADFDKRSKVILGAAETVYQRTLLLLAIVAFAGAPGSRLRLRRALGLLGGIFAVSPPGWIAYLLWTVQGLVSGRALWARPGPAFAVAVVGTTAAAHALFFGAGRYAMVTYPLMAIVAAGAFDTRVGSGDTRPEGIEHGVDRD